MVVIIILFKWKLIGGWLTHISHATKLLLKIILMDNYYLH